MTVYLAVTEKMLIALRLVTRKVEHAQRRHAKAYVARCIQRSFADDPTALARAFNDTMREASRGPV